MAFKIASTSMVGAACLALAPTGADARASQWWYVAHGADRALFVDVPSIERDGDIVTYSVSQVLRDPANPAGSIRAYMRTDCARRTETWLMVMRYGRNDERLDETALSYDGAEPVEPGTLGDAQLKFVCATDRADAGGFALGIDEAAFTDALIADDADPAALHERMRADPKVLVVRSTAPGPETFGTPQQVAKGEAIVPPRDYARGKQVPDPANYDTDESGTIYDIAYMGIADGELTFEQRGYSIDDLAHPSSGQTMTFPLTQKTVQFLDVAIDIVQAGPDSLRFRAALAKRDSGPPCPADDCAAANETTATAVTGP